MREQSVEAHALDAGGGEHVRRHVRIVRDDPQPERLGLRRQRARDVAEADQAEHLRPARRWIGTTAGISQRPACTSLFDSGTLRASASSSAIA